jgi:hypothetical protein
MPGSPTALAGGNATIRYPALSNGELGDPQSVDAVCNSRERRTRTPSTGQRSSRGSPFRTAPSKRRCTSTGRGWPSISPTSQRIGAGWEGVKEYASLEGQLSLLAEHDGLGTVTIKVTVRQPWPPDWSFEAELEFGSGAHLEGIAREVAAFQR